MSKLTGWSRKGSQKNDEHEQNQVCIMYHIPDFVHVLSFSSENLSKLSFLSHGEAKTPPIFQKLLKLNHFDRLNRFWVVYRIIRDFPSIIEIFQRKLVTTSQFFEIIVYYSSPKKKLLQSKCWMILTIFKHF